MAFPCYIVVLDLEKRRSGRQLHVARAAEGWDVLFKGQEMFNRGYCNPVRNDLEDQELTHGPAQAPSRWNARSPKPDRRQAESGQMVRFCLDHFAGKQKV